MGILQSPSSRWLAGIALVVLVAVVLSVVLALVNRRGVSLLAEDTPEGVVQRYLLAIEEDDSKRAYSYLSSELQEYCTYRHFLDSMRVRERRDMRISLEGTEALDGDVEVRVKVTETRLLEPFGFREYTYPARYVLEREGDAWRFSEPPWPLGWCPGLERKPGAVPSPEAD